MIFRRSFFEALEKNTPESLASPRALTREYFSEERPPQENSLSLTRSESLNTQGNFPSEEAFFKIIKQGFAHKRKNACRKSE
jgi:hypothetical protein